MQETQVWSLGLEDSPGGGNGNPLQYSCWDNPMDRGAWRAAVHGLAENQTRLSDWVCVSAVFWYPSLWTAAPLGSWREEWDRPWFFLFWPCSRGTFILYHSFTFSNWLVNNFALGIYSDRVYFIWSFCPEIVDSAWLCTNCSVYTMGREFYGKAITINYILWPISETRIVVA